MNSIKLDLKRRLARVEITPSATHWADLEAASHREQLRALARICEVIRKLFLLRDMDPALAVSLHIGEDAAAELAAIPDSEALRTADEAITHIVVDDGREAGSRFWAKIQRMAANICEVGQPDFAHASVAELLAYCVAMEKWVGVIDNGPSEQTADLPDGLSALARA